MEAPFKIGQKVICISTSPSLRYVKGETYVVAACYKCPSCDKWYVGCEGCFLGYDNFNCVCGQYVDHTGVFFGVSFASRFAPIQTIYADATAEILEKFPLENGGKPDKVVQPIKEIINS